jgi:steroid delta-isomerase-like uncharacterized protein
MFVQENKALVRRYYQEVFNEHNLASFDQLAAPDAIDHSLPPGLPQGIEGTRQILGMYLTAFPDVQVTVGDLIAEGDRVVARLVYTGTHQGDFLGIPPTGRRITVTATDIIRIADGKMVEHWGNSDQLGLLQQLGAIPSPSLEG